MSLIIPEELKGKIAKWGSYGITFSAMQFDKQFENIIKEWPGVDYEVVIDDETLVATCYLIFDNTEDCLAYKLKYGNNKGK
jgi:hypothetical protein